MVVPVFACPVTRVVLRRVPIAEADELCGSPLQPPRAVGYTPVGRTDEVLVRTDGTGAYPVQEGVPVLLSPEVLTPADTVQAVDVSDPTYAEAYEEMAHYSEGAARDALKIAQSPVARAVDRIRDAGPGARASFPDPPSVWLDATYEQASQHDAYEHLAPLEGSRGLVIGGRGVQAVKLLLAGAPEVWVISPMVGELVYARELARYAGVEDRLVVAAGLAEELPVADGTFDFIYSQGCVHHWVIETAMPECTRVLRPGGRFAAVEPWRAPLYGIGTKILGKRDKAVSCVVLTADRIEPHLGTLGPARVVHHGALTRSPPIGLWKFGVKPKEETIAKVGRFDDRVSASIPGLADKGSSVVILGQRPA